VKTRLGRTIGDGAAAELYEAFLRDLAARFADAPFAVGWYVTPGSWAELARVLPRSGASLVLEQEGDDWTERQRHLFRTACGRGPVVLVASDSPQLEPAVVLAAFGLLARHDVVLGPVRDGGYYLIGMRAWRDVLAGVAMSTGDVCERIAERCRALGATLGLVEDDFDVDEAADLVPLRAVVDRRSDLPFTAAALAGIGPRR
jgi:glycosyltransferase A (GT-A) superfamily protein (DUF2064 family)